MPCREVANESGCNDRQSQRDEGLSRQPRSRLVAQERTLVFSLHLRGLETIATAGIALLTPTSCGAISRIQRWRLGRTRKPERACRDERGRRRTVCSPMGLTLAPTSAIDCRDAVIPMLGRNKIAAMHPGSDMDSQRKILKSWKAIASYLGVGIRTAQRWKHERGLPVRQPGAKRRAAVLGLPDEIDRWLRNSKGTRAKRQEERLGLIDIDATDLLWSRYSRPVHFEREVEALLELGRSIARQHEGTLSRISSYALEICKAESSGFSILEAGEDGMEIFRWTATCGRMQAFEGGTTPAHFSPCGVCLERNSPLLFRHPERVYSYLEPISPIAELMLIPLHDGIDWIGTLWAICHEKRRQFDREDARLMMDLGSIASAIVSAKRARAEDRDDKGFGYRFDPSTTERSSTTE
jgi:hypothetical protein